MRSLLLLALSSTALGAVVTRKSSSVNTHCPTVTATATVCSTCVVKECLAISTISNPCDCAPVPTVTASYPCLAKGSSCPAGCASTMYVSATSSSTCPGSTPTGDPSYTLTTVTLSSPASSPTVTKSSPSTCPTVTSTRGAVCSTCAQAMCALLSTVTKPCGCAAVETSYTDYPCGFTTTAGTFNPPVYTTIDKPCPTGCALTSYIIEEEPCSSSSSSSSSNSDSLVTCTPTVTISAFPTSGCTYSCATGWNACIMDKFVTLPCGCSTAAGVVTNTVTVPCATTTPCSMCNTGFPWTTTATNCPTSAL